MLRIVTLNLNYYVEKHGPWPLRKKLILEQLHEINPHIIAFQAVARHPDLYNGKDQAMQIYEELHGFQSYYFAEAQTLPGDLKQGSAVLSKFPIIAKSFQKLTLKPGLDDPNHRIVVRTTFERPEGAFDFYNAHFSWVPEQALANAEESLRFMENGKTHALLAGDLNTPPESRVFLPFIRKGFTDAWQKLHGDNNGFTFESDHPSVRIDYFWVSSSLAEEINKVEIISSPAGNPERLSDHLGLIMELNINPDHA